MKRLIFLMAILDIGILAGMVTGCVSARRGEPLAGPLTVSSPAVARGQVAFMHYCHACHPGGDAGLGPALNNKPLPGFMIKTQVRLGLGAMPAFSKKVIKTSDLSDIVAYLKAQRHRKPGA